MQNRGSRYTKEEVILCTYAAMYDENDFGGISAIHSLENRSERSIKMKIMNIAAMLDEKKIMRFNKHRIKPLTGLPTGVKGRRTNWETVKYLCSLEKAVFLEICKKL